MRCARQRSYSGHASTDPSLEVNVEAGSSGAHLFLSPRRNVNDMQNTLGYERGEHQRAHVACVCLRVSGSPMVNSDYREPGHHAAA